MVTLKTETLSQVFKENFIENDEKICWTFPIFCGMMCGYKGGAVMAKRRPSGDGMVRKRDDGRWEGRIVVGHKNNGDPIYRYVFAKTQAELI